MIGMRQVRSAATGWLVAGLLVLLAAAGAAGAAGGYAFAESKGNAEIERIKGQHAKDAEAAATALKAATETARQNLVHEIERGNALEAGLLDLQAAFDLERNTLQRRIRDVSTQYRKALGAALQPVPRAVFTVAWVRDYNCAIGAPTDVPCADPATAGGGAGAQAGTATGTDAGLLLDSKVTPEDILAHITDYGARCRKIGAQANALIDRWEAQR